MARVVAHGALWLTVDGIAVSTVHIGFAMYSKVSEAFFALLSQFNPLSGTVWLDESLRVNGTVVICR